MDLQVSKMNLQVFLIHNFKGIHLNVSYYGLGSVISILRRLSHLILMTSCDRCYFTLIFQVGKWTYPVLLSWLHSWDLNRDDFTLRTQMLTHQSIFPQRRQANRHLNMHSHTHMLTCTHTHKHTTLICTHPSSGSRHL